LWDARANLAISRVVVEGDTTASPRATVRMAVTSASAVVSLSRKPLAPARNAAYRYASTSKVVSMRCGGDEP
jgi:hypothetical protein